MTPQKDTVRLVIDLMKETFKGGPFKEWYDGDPEVIPDFNLPCLVVSLLGDTTTTETTASDQVVERVIIKVIFNKKDDWTTEVDPLNMTERKIREIIGRIEEDSGSYSMPTIKGVLRSQLSENNLVLDDEMTVELGIAPRANDVLTAEGHVIITVGHSIGVQRL
jgi:hypothetical protein